jgi:hypothetical protein
MNNRPAQATARAALATDSLQTSHFWPIQSPFSPARGRKETGTRTAVGKPRRKHTNHKSFKAEDRGGGLLGRKLVSGSSRGQETREQKKQGNCMQIAKPVKGQATRHSNF